MKNRTHVVLLMICTITAWLASIRSLQSHENITTTVLFDREIVRILSKKCIGCHADNTLAFR
jgi:hypothetical protein